MKKVIWHRTRECVNLFYDDLCVVFSTEHPKFKILSDLCDDNPTFDGKTISEKERMNKLVEYIYDQKSSCDQNEVKNMLGMASD